ncbi:DNA-binding response regulator [Lachnospiraceae bacterium]|jgi:two-component system response regulator ResD|nr:response regulator transcription factor [uncultured Schaedlerella sp.]MCI9154522.1 response regulator transcription factor [Ruminococcus sp.]NBI60045.1 DNA-binding response regulator [Lachnospiraceae bacterium]
MAVIFYAEDEKEIRDIVSAFLVNDGYEVVTFENGDLLLEEFKNRPCDLVLLDIMMPGTDGIGVLTALRAISKVPVIMLTAKDTDSDYYSGLSLGSDDYITKPFKPMILSVKIKALLRRIEYEKQALPEQSSQNLECGNLRYSGKKHVFQVGKEILSLTPTEMRFLEYMMKHFEEAVSKNEILDEIWNMNYDVETRVADETNRRLRKKLTAAGADVYVQTVWGYGFKLTIKDKNV